MNTLKTLPRGIQKRIKERTEAIRAADKIPAGAGIRIALAPLRAEGLLTHERARPTTTVGKISTQLQDLMSRIEQRRADVRKARGGKGA